MSKINKKAVVTFAFIGSAFSLAALLIFMLLPTSEIANGIQYSGKDALWILILSPVFSFIGAISFMFAFLKDYKLWKGYLTNFALFGFLAVSAVLLVSNFSVYLTYLISQFDLGFVAPYTGTVFDKLEILVIIVTVLQFTVATLIAVKAKNK